MMPRSARLLTLAALAAVALFGLTALKAPTAKPHAMAANCMSLCGIVIF